MNNPWHNPKTYEPPRPADHSSNFYYLCEVSGLNNIRHIVLSYDADGKWWIYVPKMAGPFEGGWLGLPEQVKVLRWKFIEND